MIKIVEKYIRPLVSKFIGKIEVRYLIIFPLPLEILKFIREESDSPNDRLKAINKIRTNNIVTTIWAKTGTILGIIITLIGLMLTGLLATYIPFEFVGGWLTLLFFFSVIAIAILIYYVLINVIPFLVRRIVFHLPSGEYADLSMNSLDKSEMLTFLALRMWELCHKFIDSIEIPKNIENLSKLGTKDEVLQYFINNRSELKLEIDQLYISINKYSADYNKDLNNCISLMKLASQKLDIQERELLNHVLKFSPYIFRRRVESMKSSASALKYIIYANSGGNKDFQSVLHNNMSEVLRIRKGVKESSMRSLKQIILYDNIHSCLIGMSSIVSTSRSLKIFCEGLGNSLKDRNENNPIANSSATVDVCIEKFKSIIHRSKAHYGMDLLILLENFCKARYDGTSLEHIPEAIYNIKYPKRVKKLNLVGYFKDKKEEEIINEVQSDICNLREYMLKEYTPAMKYIKDRFKKKLKDLEKIDEKKYFVLFGYSRIVRNILKSFANEIYDQKIITFVIKEDTKEMIDTQIYRFELNDDKPNYNIRKTFTASDEFLIRLIDEQDKVIFIGGAEAYDISRNKLFHTNNYQHRVMELLNEFSTINKTDTEIWILAGNYKLFKEFPDNNSLFGNEFFSDHYDKIDLYDLKKYKNIVSLITNE